MINTEQYTSLPIAKLLKDEGISVDVSAVYSFEKQTICDNGGRKFRPFKQDTGLYTFEELEPMFPEWLEVRSLNNGFVVYDLHDEDILLETWSSLKADAAAKLLLRAERFAPGSLANIEEITKTWEEAKSLDLSDWDLEINNESRELINNIRLKELHKECVLGDYGQKIQQYLVGNSKESNSGDFLVSVKSMIISRVH
jgi:hypothetical protein